MESEKRGWKATAELLWMLFSSFFSVGIFTIGGGLAMIPLIMDFAVEKKKWLTDDEMVDCLAVCQALPGAVVINVATYIGKRVSGIAGSLAATAGVILPSFICIILIMLVLRGIGENPYVAGVFEGAKAAAAALVLVACINLGKRIIQEPFHWILAIAACGAILFFHVSALLTILAGAMLGLVRFYLLQGMEKRKERKAGGGDEK